MNRATDDERSSARSRTERPVYHVITPGDHFSPRTGSAIPTVVHGLATGAAKRRRTDRYPQHVVVQRATYTPRYESAAPVEFQPTALPDRAQRLMDVARGRLRLRRKFAQRSYDPIIDALQTVSPGIVIAHNATPLPETLEHSQHRVILYAHNASLFRSLSNFEANRVVSSCDFVVCVSEYVRQTLSARVPRALRSRFRVVRSGVDTVAFSPDSRGPREGLRVLFIGRTIPGKGADVLLQAGALLGLNDLEYTIVGSHGFDPTAELTDFEHRLRTISESVPHVRFKPFVDREKLPALLHDADVLVVPSRGQEAWALTVGEGMAAGLTVIASRLGGIPEQLGDAGILVPPGDVSKLADALRVVRDDPGRRKELGRLARTRALAQDWAWSWDAFQGVLDDVPSPAASL